MSFPVPINASAMAARFDYWIKGYGQTVTIYSPDRSVATGIVTENAPELVGTAIAMLQFGEEMEDFMTGAGVDPNKFCVAFFASEFKDMVHQRRYVLDAGGQWWLIHSLPAQQPMPTPIGCCALLERQLRSPIASPTV